MPTQLVGHHKIHFVAVPKGRQRDILTVDPGVVVILILSTVMNTCSKALLRGNVLKESVGVDTPVRYQVVDARGCVYPCWQLRTRVDICASCFGVRIVKTCSPEM